MKKLFYFCLLTPVLALAQSTDQNYVKTTVYKGPGSTLPQQSVTYFDGLGRPIQKIEGSQSATGQDIITHIEYDTYGRPVKEYLPFPSSQATLNFMDPASAQGQTIGYYQNAYGDTNPFSEKLLEASPLDRVLKQAAPGNSWAMGSGHEIKMDYQSNAANEVKLFQVTTTWDTTAALYQISIANSGFYDENQLYKTITKDENWTSGHNNTTEEFKDKEGRVVLKRTFNNEEAHDTYYVYDDFGNLTYVLPPLAEGAIDTNTLDGLCYQYKYDYRNRLAAKKLPGKQWEFIVYDTLDRPVATGPANSPFGNNGAGTLITQYDVFGRVVKTGWKALAMTEANRATWHNNLVAGTNPFVLANNDVLTLNYYDSYDGAIPQAVEGQTVATNVKGLATENWVRILGAPNQTLGESSYTLYDSKYRPIRSHTDNYLGGYTQVDSKLDFMGKTLYTVTTHKRTGNDTETLVRDEFTYTAQDRLVQHTHQINGGDIIPLTVNEYDALGQLKSKNVGGSLGNYILQKVDYTYNIRGWLKGINDVGQLKGDGADPYDLFAFKLNYNAPDTATPLYNGNISESFWRTNNDDILRKYDYNYDALNRLTLANFSKPENASFTNSYKEQLEYDKNGNITYIERNGGVEEENNEYLIDALQYTYNYNSPNQLMQVHDLSNSPQGFNESKDHFIRGSDTDYDYAYDDYGNLTRDDNKGITSIIYNHLNLPVEINFEDNTNKKITYLYDATGRKVAKTVHWIKEEITWGGGGEEMKSSSPSNLVPTTTYTNVTDVTDYLSGGYQYKNTFLQFMPHAEGYVDYSDGSPLYTFNYTDHLGNVRLSYRDDGSGNAYAIDESNYYPFGLRHEGYNGSAVTGTNWNGQDPNGNPNKYKYNGQEWQNELGLDLYDYDNRVYDPATGRFLQIDPKGELGRRWSSYNYCFDNPMYFRDPDGMWPWPSWSQVKNLASGFASTVMNMAEGAQPHSMIIGQAKLAYGVGKSLYHGDYKGAKTQLINATGVPGAASTVKKAIKGDSRAIGEVLGVVSVFAITHQAAKGGGGTALVNEGNIGKTITEGTVNSESPTNNTIKVTQESVSKALEDSNLKTTQAKVSAPIVERYIQKLQEGSQAPPIKVTSDGVLIDGNHRYVAGKLFGTDPETVPGSLSPSQASKVVPIQETKVDPNDWGPN